MRFCAAVSINFPRKRYIFQTSTATVSIRVNLFIPQIFARENVYSGVPHHKIIRGRKSLCGSCNDWPNEPQEHVVSLTKRAVADLSNPRLQFVQVRFLSTSPDQPHPKACSKKDKSPREPSQVTLSEYVRPRSETRGAPAVAQHIHTSFSEHGNGSRTSWHGK